MANSVPSSNRSAEQLALFPLEPGVTVKVSGVRGIFTVIGNNADGSVQVYGGTRQQYRSFPQDRVHPSKKYDADTRNRQRAAEMRRKT